MRRTQIVAGNSMGVLRREVPNHKFSQIFLKEWTIATNYHPEYLPHHQGICRRKFEPFKTIHASKIRGNVVEVSFRSRIRRKARNFVEFRRQVFALLLHNTVAIPHGWPLNTGLTVLWFTFFVAIVISYSNVQLISINNYDLSVT